MTYIHVPGDSCERAHDNRQTDAQRIQTTRDYCLQVELLTEPITCEGTHKKVLINEPIVCEGTQKVLTTEPIIHEGRTKNIDYIPPIDTTVATRELTPTTMRTNPTR